MTRIRSALLVSLVVLLSPAVANAVLISTSAGDFEVTTVAGSFEDFEDLLTSQVWWGDQDLALEFAGQNLMGLPISGSLGPFFVTLFDIETDLVEGAVWIEDQLRAAGFSTSPDNSRAIFAIAERVSVPEPGTLALLGIGLASLGLARLRRKT